VHEEKQGCAKSFDQDGLEDKRGETRVCCQDGLGAARRETRVEKAKKDFLLLF